WLSYTVLFKKGPDANKVWDDGNTGVVELKYPGGIKMFDAKTSDWMSKGTSLPDLLDKAMALIRTELDLKIVKTDLPDWLQTNLAPLDLSSFEAIGEICRVFGALSLWSQNSAADPEVYADLRNAPLTTTKDQVVALVRNLVAALPDTVSPDDAALPFPWESFF